MLLLFLRRWLHEWGDMEGVVGVFLSSRVGIHEEYTRLTKKSIYSVNVLTSVKFVNTIMWLCTL